MKRIKNLTNKDLKNNYDYYLTVGKLKKFLEETELSDDAKVLIERVEDVYFEKHGWETYPKPNIIIGDLENHYVPAFSCLKYDDDEHLFIDLHY